MDPSRANTETSLRLGCAIWRESHLFLLFADIDLLFLAKFSGAFHGYHQARSVLGKDTEVRAARDLIRGLNGSAA